MSQLPQSQTRPDSCPPLAHEWQKRSSPNHKALQIKEKKAMLYHLKNKLLKYDSFEEVPIEELENLCENINFQNHSNASNSEDEIQVHPSPRQTHSGSIETVSAAHLQASECCQNVYVVKLKEIMVILLVVLCIVVKNNISTSTTYDMGDYSIYETRYAKSTFDSVVQSQNQKENSGFKFIQNLLGSNEKDEKVKLYLPKALQKARRKDQRELSYEKCIDSYNPICIDHRLSLYGSMNLQLEDWILDHITGQEKIVFESSIDYLLSIVLTALKMRQLHALGRATTKIALIENQHLDSVELNSIKLSLIENECLNYVEIIKVQHEDFDKLASYDYVILSQELYTYYVYPFGQKTAKVYPSTTFLLYMPKGISDTLKIHIKQDIGERKIFQIKFNFKDNIFYREIQIFENELIQNTDKKMVLMLIRPAVRSSSQNERVKVDTKPVINPSPISSSQLADPAVTKNPAPDDTGTIPPVDSLQQVDSPLLELLPPAQRQQLVLEEHPCIVENKYEVLPIMSLFDSYVYIDTVMGFKLLVSEERAVQYKQKGAISPELLFFITQNLKSSDTVFFAEQLYHDNLILLTIAKTVANKENLFCVTTDTNHPVLTENLRMNGGQVSFAYLNIEMESQMRQFYSEHDFTVYFTTFSFLSRDYKKIFNPSKPKLVIFYWLLDINYLDFVKGLTRRHKVWAIMERFEKMSFLDACMNYGLMEVSGDSVVQTDRSWLVIQM